MITFEQLAVIRSLRDFRLPPRRRWDLRCSVIVHST